MFNDGYELKEEVDDETQADIFTAAFKLDFVFVTVKSWYDSFNETTFRRRLGKPGKGPGKEQKEGNPNAVNHSCKNRCGINTVEQCKFNCGNRKWYGDSDRLMRKLKDSASDVRLSLDGNFTGTDFNEILRMHTVLNPIETGAVLDATSFEDITSCRANNYNAIESESPLLECGDYNEFQCDLNDYMIMNDDQKCNID